MVLYIREHVGENCILHEFRKTYSKNADSVVYLSPLLSFNWSGAAVWLASACTDSRASRWRLTWAGFIFISVFVLQIRPPPSPFPVVILHVLSTLQILTHLRQAQRPSEC